MILRTFNTGTVTMTAATASSTISDVTGRIKSIAIKPSGTSTDFRISIKKAGVTEYILGTSAGVSILAAGEVFYPVVLRVTNDNGALTATGNTFGEICLDSQDITITVSNGTAAETYSVEILVEE